MSNSIVRQVGSFGLNQMAPGIMTLGPLTLGLGSLIGLAMTVMGGLFGDDPVRQIPESIIVDSASGTLTEGDTGEPVITGSFGPFQKWVLSVASNYAKLLAFFTNGVPDYSTFNVKLQFEEWSYGIHGTTTQWAPDFIPGVGLGGMAGSIEVPNVMMPRWYVHVQSENGNISYDAQDHFDSTMLFWKIIRTLLVMSNQNIDASILTILRYGDDDEAAVDAAVAQRKKDLVLAKQNMADLQHAIADLKKQHATLTALQDADLYQQQVDFLQQQMDVANSQLDALASATATSDSVTGAKTPSAAPAIPVLLLLSLLS